MATSNQRDEPPLTGDRHPAYSDDLNSQTKRTQKPPTINPPPVLAPTAEPESSKPSRESSPSRPNARALDGSKIPHTSRSRKNSQDLSPNRAISTNLSSQPSVPSAAAVQRALSAANKTQQSPNIDGVFEAPRAEQLYSSRSSEVTPQWPRSPRITSPPPPVSVRNLHRKSDSETVPSNTSIKRLAVSTPAYGQNNTENQEGPKSAPSKDVSNKTSASEVSTPRTSLPTVTEDVVPPHSAPLSKTPLSTESNGSTASSKAEDGESGNDSGENRQLSARTGENEQRRDQPLGPSRSSSAIIPKRSLTSMNLTKTKPTVDPPLRSMTVETETVSSIPQVSLNVGGGERGVSGRSDPNSSVRLQPSNETIRPKKEKKKVTRKQPSINAGTVSSKADIFEAKVASAVDEANSSDSDETFVYESNPAESQNAQHFRHHSRTPSATSMASQKDFYASKYARPNVKDGGRGVTGKRSMKFTNTFHHNNLDGEMAQGSLRSDGRSGNATPRHHHIGRYGRGGHPSLFDSDSPFQQGNKPTSPRTSYGTANGRSRPNSPRVAAARIPPSARKPEAYGWENDEEAADDERAPLIGSVRISRNRHGRRPNSSSLRQMEYIGQRRRSFSSRYGACAIVTILIVVIILGATIFVVGLTKSLLDVEVRRISNVLASEQEIMLDLDVRATNPNLFAITVSDMDVNIFAKSGYVGNSEAWRYYQEELQKLETFAGEVGKHRETRSLRVGKAELAWPGTRTIPGGIDEGNDPIEDPAGDPQTMLLGRIFEFDSPLVFDASPLQRQSSRSSGELRLAKPGNKTEVGGSARWEKVLQHPFELIVRGVLKYQLPLSSRYKSASINSRVKVDPEDESDNKGSHNSSSKSVITKR